MNENTKQIIFVLVVIAFYAAILPLGGLVGLAIQSTLGGVCFGWLTVAVARTIFKD